MSAPTYIDIPLDAIEIPSDARKLVPEGVERLAETIEVDGQLEPIAVRPNPLVKDSYILIFGHHRIEACRRLKHKTIRAQIFEMGADEAIAARAAENLYRTTLDAAEHGLALLEWERIHYAKNPKPARGSAGGAAKNAMDRGEPLPKSKTFVAKIAKARGVSSKRVSNELGILKKLGEGSLSALNGCGCKPFDLAKFAAIKDKGVREQAIKNMVGIADVTVDGAIGLANTPRGSTDSDVGTVDPEAGRVLTDEEWIDQECVQILSGLKHQVAFRKDATIYRQSLEIRRKFEKAMKPILDASNAKIHKCGFYRAIMTVVTVEHPKHWLICGKCNGTGMYQGFQCMKCLGTAYVVNWGETR
jgi:hypothetical protein